ncbi:manganese ion binding protein [Aureococcus anophagefferens]|nr:manganese ion binding protein [Aureococcus anophagefferens]
MLMLLALLPAARALRAPASTRAHPSLRRASSVDLSFEAAAAPASTTVYAGLKDAVAQQAPAGVDAALWAALVDSVKPGDDGAAASTAYARDGELHRPRRRERGHGGRGRRLPPQGRRRAPAAPRVPLYDAKKGKDDGAPRTVRVAFEDAGGAPVADERTLRARRRDAVRRAAHRRRAPNEMTTTRLVAEARDVAARLRAAGVAVDEEVLAGAAEGRGLRRHLQRRKRGGAAGARRAVGEVPGERGRPVRGPRRQGRRLRHGRPLLKISGGMVGMKSDCGGAAAVLGGFEAACALGGGAYEEIHCLLCVAENAIGPDAMRCDDIVTFFSGLTCEINNTDAEGRLCLADGMVSTGQRHAAVFSDDEALEARAVAAGKRSGDLCHPLPFAPEIYRAEFKSKVADMKNSVKDRMNAQASCAANFIYENVHADFQGSWLHVDLAGPSTAAERGTGFGVALALALLDVDGFEA